MEDALSPGMGARGTARWASMALVAVAVSCIPPPASHDMRGQAPISGSLARGVALAPAGTGAAVTTPAGADSAGADAQDAVVLVVLDGVRWQDVFVGADPALAADAGVQPLRAESLTPNLHALVADRGAAIGAPGQGAPMQASGPNYVSLPGYNEILSGRRVTACKDNDCDPTRLRTVMDEARAVARRPSDVAVIASWPKIERACSADPASIVVSAGRTEIEHREVFRSDPIAAGWLASGAQADPFPGYGGYRPDRYTAGLALRYLETERPRMLFLGLGEPDEYAHRDDYRGYLESLRASDGVIGDLFATLARMGERGRRTTVFVTADHGRGRDYRVHGRDFPESSRVWLVAAGAGIHARGLVHATRDHRFADVAPTIRMLLDLPADVSPEAGAPLDELFAAPPMQSAALP